MGIGQRIKEISKSKGLTLRQLAQNADVSYNTIYSITKRDSERIQGNILQRISLALEVSPSELIGYEGEALDEVLGLILDEYPKAAVSPGGEKNSFRISLGANHRANLLKYFDLLNDDGQQKAVESVEIIAGNPKYQRTDLPVPPDAPPASQAGPATTPPKKPPEGPGGGGQAARKGWRRAGRLLKDFRPDMGPKLRSYCDFKSQYFRTLRKSQTSGNFRI